MKVPRIFKMTFGSVYPHYVKKVLSKDRTEEELLELITWLTGYSEDDITEINKSDKTFEEFFNEAPMMHENRVLIKGSVCGVKVQDIEDPLMKNIRYLDKIVDELAKGKAMEKILRK